MKENISHIRQRLEPSSELKRRVMENAAKLDAGRKTFGSETATTDNRQIQKEHIQMNALNTYENAKVKKEFPIAVISAAACAAVVIGIAAVSLKGNEPKPLPTTENAAGQSSIDTNDQNIIGNDDSTTENVMTVTENDGSTFTITDKDRIAAIDALVEKSKESHIWEGEISEPQRTLEYVVDGKERIVELSEEQAPAGYHPDAFIRPEFCLVVTVDGASYALCELTPDEPFSELLWATNKGGDMFFQSWDNDAEHFSAGYNDETAERKLCDIIENIRSSETPQYDTDDIQAWYKCEQIPDWKTARISCDFDLDGNHYNIELYQDSDLIVIDLFDWHNSNTHHYIYKDTHNWIAELDEVFNTLKGESDSQEEDAEMLDSQEEDIEMPDSREDELSGDNAVIPDLFGLTEEQAVAALNEAGLNCIIGYQFNSTEKGYVCSFYDPSEDLSGIVSKGTYIPVDISLGEYDGPYEMIKPEHTTGYYPTKDSKLEVPVPDGLSGSYTFDIYFAGSVFYTETIDNINSVKSVTFDTQESDKTRLVIYAKNNNSKEEKLIRYATYEFDYAAETWTLIGELNTDGLLKTMD